MCFAKLGISDEIDLEVLAFLLSLNSLANFVMISLQTRSSTLKINGIDSPGTLWLKSSSLCS